MERLEEKSFVVLDVEEATGRPRLVAALHVAPNPRIGLFVSNNPVNWSDPMGMDQRTGMGAGGINNKSQNPVNVYEPESGTKTVDPGKSSPSGHDWDSVESPAGSGNWEKIGPGVSDIDKNGDIDSNPMRWLDKLLHPDRYKPGNFPVPPKDQDPPVRPGAE